MRPELVLAIARQQDLRAILQHCNDEEIMKFMLFLREADLDVFEKIIPLYDVNMRASDNSTILHYLLGVTHFNKRINILLRAGASLNFCDQETGCGTLLHLLLANEEFEKFNDLLSTAVACNNKIDFHLQDSEGKTPLMLAAKVMASGAVRRILALNTTCVDIPDNEGRTPLHIACALGQAWIVEQLLKAGANINARDHAGNTPAHYAVFNKAEVRQLLSSIHIDPKRDAHARLNAIHDSEFSALGVQIDAAEVLKLRLTTSPVDMVKGTSIGNITVCKKNKDPLRAILKTNFFNLSVTQLAHVENDLQRQSGKSIGQDCMAGHLAVMKMLVRCGADVTQANQAGDRPITHCQDQDIKACLKDAARRAAMFGCLFEQKKVTDRTDNNTPSAASSFPTTRFG